MSYLKIMASIAIMGLAIVAKDGGSTHGDDDTRITCPNPQCGAGNAPGSTTCGTCGAQLR